MKKEINILAPMKKSFVLIASAVFVHISLAFAPAAQAQTADPAAKLQKLSQQLQLTPEQKMKILPVLKEEAPKLEAIKNNSSLSGMQKMKQLQAIHNESAPQMQHILSPAQYQKLQVIRRQEAEEAIAKKRARP